MTKPSNAKLSISICFTIIFTLNAFFINAQRVNSLYFLENTPLNARLNPSMTPIYSGFGIGMSNFTLYFQSDIAFEDLFYSGENDEQNRFMNPEIDRNTFINNLKDISSLKMSTNMDLFNLGIRINKKNYISLHSGIYIDAGLGLPKDFFELFMRDMEDETSFSSLNLTGLNLEAMVYSKTGIGFSTQFGKNISVGIGVNRLNGFINASMNFDRFNIDVTETGWDITTDGYFQIAGPEDLMFRYSDDGYFNGIESSFNTNSSGEFATTFNSITKVGSGYSLDFGLTVRALDFISLSASLTDLGSIMWHGDYIQKARSNGSFTYQGEIINENDNNSEEGMGIDKQIQELTRFRKVDGVESYKTSLTTKMNIGAEFGILKNKITLGVLSQSGFTEDGNYNDIMVSANLKPGNYFQTALTYSRLHGEANSFGAAVNTKMLFFNFFIAADFIPSNRTTNTQPDKDSFYKFQTGLNFMF